MKTEMLEIVTPRELAKRWRIRWQTLANWRVEGKGPKYMKLGKFVFYSIEEVVAWEKGQTKRSTVS